MNFITLLFKYFKSAWHDCILYTISKCLVGTRTSQGHNVLVVLVISHFGFKDRILVLNVSVPGHCLLFTFNAVFPNHGAVMRPMKLLIMRTAPIFGRMNYHN